MFHRPFRGVLAWCAVRPGARGGGSLPWGQALLHRRCPRIVCLAGFVSCVLGFWCGVFWDFGVVCFGVLVGCVLGFWRGMFWDF